MATRKPKYFTVEEANRMLPLVRPIVADVVRQWETVRDLEQRLATVARRKPRAGAEADEPDFYEEEVAQSRGALEAEKARFNGYLEELDDLGVELKGADGLCDFLSLRDGREVYLCWRLGEPEVAHWHELRGGFTGRQPLQPELAAPARSAPTR